MSYLDYPRIHFSGTYQASPSTINNTPNNYNPLIYPTPNELEKVELYWNPRGDGGFALMDDCVVKQVDYADGTSATTSEQDAIIGQPVKAVYSSSFPLQAALVDLDPMQQNTSEIWAMVLQIGKDTANLTGKVPNVSFTGIWGQCQGPTAPHSSASGSAAFQVKMTDVTQTGEASGSRFLQHFKDDPSAFLSLNINTNAHNNSPPNYLFDSDIFTAMATANVPSSVLTKMEPMKNLFQNSQDLMTADGKTIAVPVDPGLVPTKVFVKYMLQQYLTVDEFNANIDIILKQTEMAYNGATSYDFLFGMITGSAGPAVENDPAYFVPSRELVPQKGSSAFYAPFIIDDTGIITLNLGNSLPTETPGNNVYTKILGDLWLVAFPGGDISLKNAKKLVQIPYESKDFLANQAGLFTTKLEEDWSTTPLGILSTSTSDLFTAESILLAEDKDGRYLRADSFVYRMNPGFSTTPEFPRGATNTVDIHALKFGKRVADGTEISLTMKTQKEAEDYTIQTLGTSGTLGIENLSLPQDALTFPATAATQNGVATFEMTAVDPGNKRIYVDGQVYFLDYNFVINPINKDYKDPNDLVSVMVYSQDVEEEATVVLAKFGRLYKIMGFLADEEKIKQIDLRNMIKTLLQRPMTNLVHMPVTRDLSAAARKKVVEWVDTLNNS